ncbi:MAG TPA: MotA/TolQ/ExbB proton channel family protein [Planctomycetota bacterium]|nr:MotA/TolQ/ExbB proton channel family protein [Planctomycetota bacterium]
MEENLWSLISRTVMQSGSIEQAVFFLLVGFSLISWTLVLWKICALYECRKNGQKFMTVFNGADSFGTVLTAEATVGASPLLSIFKSAVQAMENARPQAAPSDPRRISPKALSPTEETVLVSMQHTSKAEFSKLQTGLSFLATIGSTSPFIGLFGTVWGIMDTFRELGNAKSASIQVVAPGISSALIATAAGLAVAIPAVMAYNWFLGQIDDLEENADCFIERLAVLIKTSGWNGGAPAVESQATPHDVTVALPPMPPAAVINTAVRSS